MATTSKKPKTVAAAKAKPAIKTIKATKPQPSTTLRTRKVAKYKSFRMTKRIPHPAGPLPKVRYLFKKTRRLLWQNRTSLLFVVIIYAVLNFVLVRSFTSPLNIADVKNTLSQSIGASANGILGTTAIFSQLLNSSSGAATSETAGVYQTILLITVSLALIWIFRQSAAGNKTSARIAFYRGMYALVPFLLVVMVMALQLIPAFIGGFVFSTVSSGGIAVSGLEQALWALFLVSTIVLSLYMLCSSLFALYIVTLPDMTPMVALRSARQLVLSRRLNVLRKLIVLPVFILLVLIILVVPAIYFLPVIAPWLYFVLTLVGLVLLHAYLFTIYRELL